MIPRSNSSDRISYCSRKRCDRRGVDFLESICFDEAELIFFFFFFLNVFFFSAKVGEYSVVAAPSLDAEMDTGKVVYSLSSSVVGL